MLALNKRSHDNKCIEFKNKYHTNLLTKCRTIKTVTLYFPKYYINAINKNTVVRHILITHRNLMGFKPNRRDKSPSFNVCSIEVMWRECRRMVLLLVAVCWCRGNRYKHSKWTFFLILHQNRFQNIIQCHNNKIWKQMCIRNLCYITQTYLQYNVQREKQVEIYMWALHHELVLFQQSRNCFCYVPDNEIKGDILVWTTSTAMKTIWPF